MKKILVMILCLLLIAALAACNPAEETAEGPFQVGYGRAVITPKIGIHMAGSFNSNKIATDILDDLYATCIAFTDATGETLLLFQMDLQRADTYAIIARQELSEAFGIHMDNIIISSTHNHSAPQTDYFFDEEKYPMDFEYAQTVLYPGIMEAAKLALEDRKPAQLYGSSIELKNMNFVRHYNLSDGSVAGDNFGSFDDKTILGHQSEADNQMQMLCFRREGGKDVVMMNWQAHTLRTGASHPNITSDFVGATRNAIEAELDCHFAYFLGASGNVNPSSRIASENITEDYKEQGKEMAKHGIMALEDMEPMKLGRIQTAKEFSNAGFTDMEVSAFSIGDVGFVVAPYEMFSANGEFIKENSPFDTTFVVTCANGKNGYFPSEDTYAYESYEYKSNLIPQGNAEEVADVFVKLLNQLHPTRELAGQTDPTLAAQPQSALYWNLDRGSERTADADGSFAVRLLCNGEVVTVKASEEMLAKIDATDVIGLTLDGDNVTAVHRMTDMSYSRVAAGYYVQSLQEGLLTLNAHSAMRGREVEFNLNDSIKMWDIKKECPMAREIQVGDMVTAVCDAEGNPVELFVTVLAADLTVLETSNRYCEHCSQEVSYYHWNINNSLPNLAGHFILEQDVELTSKVNVLGGDVCLDLNGKTVTQKTFGMRMYSVESFATLSILDSAGGGTMISTSADNTGASSGMIIYCDSAMATVKLYSGTLDASQTTAQLACAVYMKSGKMEMYGGTIKGGKTYGSGSPCMTVGELSTFEMFGGTMIGGHVQDTGFTVEVAAKGGAIMRIVGEATIYDGEFIGGYSDLNGGALYVRSDGTLNLLGGTISGGECVGTGAGLFVEPMGTLVLGGNVKILDNKGSNFSINPRAMMSIHSDGLSGAKIGVTADGPCTFLYGTFTAKDAACFVSDDPNLKVVVTESGLALVEK